MIQPTRRALRWFLALLPAAAAPALLDARFAAVWWAAAGLFAAVLGADALLARRGAGFTLEVDAPEQLFVGDPDPLHVVVRTAPRGAPAAIDVRLEVSERLVAPATATLRFDGDGVARAELVLQPRKRGPARLDEAWLRWSGPLGLVERSARRELGRDLAIVPDVRAVRQAAARMASRSPWSGRKLERFLGDGSEFQALREWVAGLDPRTIDWKATARHRKLLCRELRAERNHPLLLAFDTGRRMQEPIDGVSRLDRAINAALLLAWVGLRCEDRVALFAFDSVVRASTPLFSGTPRFGELRHAAGLLETAAEETNFTLGLTELSRRLQRRTLVVVFTDFDDAIGAELMVENLGRLARRHVVLLVAVQDAELSRMAAAPPTGEPALHQSVAAAELVRDRARVLDRVRRLGVLVLDAPAEAVRGDLVDAYLEIQRRELVA